MSTYDLTTGTPAKIATGDIINCPYSGAAKSITLPPGRYKLEAWGAQGGYRSSATYGGKGGYSVGTVTFDAAMLLYLYVGGSGITGGTSGGFNGGGKRATYPGGGGATDMRLAQDSLLARLIVAAGGGSDGASSKQGMYGGGETGGSSTQSYGSGGYGGTQTGNSWSTTTQPTGTSSSSDCYAGFGFGGNGVYLSSGYGGAGGGGWYGGSGAYPDGSGDDDRGGGGGSSYVYTAATAGNYPTGCLLDSKYYLTDAATTSGNVSFTGPTGSSETGHSGDGYARITALEVFPQTPDAPENFRQTAQDYFSVSLAWDAVEKANSYNLYRDGVLLANLTGTNYTDTGLNPSTNYIYKVAGINAEGEGDPASLTASTKEGWAVQIVKITGASFSVNPANINTKTDLSVTVTETVKILEPYFYYSGDLYAGEG